MIISFEAKEIKVIKSDYYDLIVFSDSIDNPIEYVMIQIAHEFDKQDIQLGMDGEYFEYGEDDDIGAEYKCVNQVELTSFNITFNLAPKIKGNINKIMIKFERNLLKKDAIEFLNNTFKNRLLINKLEQE